MDKSPGYRFKFEVLAALAIVVSIITISIMLLIRLNNELSKPIPVTEIKESAWIACVLYVEENWKVPRDRVQEYSLDYVTKLTEQNHYGVKVPYTDGHTYECDLARRMDGEWFVKSLYIK